MRVALCQLNTTVGAFESNVSKVLEFLKKASEERADLAVFPELVLSSYPPLDLLDRKDFIGAQEGAKNKLLDLLSSIKNLPRTVILGGFAPAESDSPGRRLENSLFVIANGRLVHRYGKRLLPTYDVFDEARYFRAAEGSKSTYENFGLSICEDAWFSKEKYTVDPAEDLKGCELAINIAASPFEKNKKQQRAELISGFVKRVGSPLVYVNAVGANDEILFDGTSQIFSKTGDILFEMPTFVESLAVVNLETAAGGRVTEKKVFEYASSKWTAVRDPSNASPPPIAVLRQALVMGIRDYFRKTGFKKAVLGLSGGIDSAVVAALAAEALGPENVIGISMPSQYSSSHSLTDAEELARNIGLKYVVHSLKFLFSTLLMELKPSFGGLEPDATEENMQARLRGVLVMALANKHRALALATGNKSELAVGYCTIYGDMAGALAPLGDVYKTTVYELAREINRTHSWVPENTLSKPPSAELRANQKDQDTLPPYDQLDAILEMAIEHGLGEGEISKKFSAKTVSQVFHLIRGSEFKRRQAAPVLKVSSKAFGIGRRVPVAKAF